MQYFIQHTTNNTEYKPELKEVSDDEIANFYDTEGGYRATGISFNDATKEDMLDYYINKHLGITDSLEYLSDNESTAKEMFKEATSEVK